MPMDWGLARDYAARDAHPEETLVTEAEWLVATQPEEMLWSLESRSSARKLRLIAVACCRRVWTVLPEGIGRFAVEVAERHADGVASDEELQKAQSDASRVADERNPIRLGLVLRRDWDDPQGIQDDAIHYFASACACSAYPTAFASAVETTVNVSLGVAMTLGRPDPHAVEQSALAHLVRDVFGNPFRNRHQDGPMPKWRGGVAASLAKSIYADRAFDRLPLLADAVEDAGCTNAELLGHLRRPGPHVRGCWAVDLVLGKS
jgi:hypothetical protein